MVLRLKTMAAVVAVMAFLPFVPPAFAHHVMGGELPSTAWQGLLSGLGHPIIGIDHFAFIVGVGLMSHLVGRIALLAFLFVAGTVLGCFLHVQGIALPWSEMAVAVTVAAAALVVGMQVTIPVGILAILIALLLPSLRAAREAATRTRCQAHLRQVGVSLQLYAVDNAGQVPVGYNDYAWAGYWFYDSSDQLYVVFGHLWKANLVANPQAFYCTGQRDPRLTFNTTDNPWTPGSQPAIRTRAGYTARPIVAWNDRPYPPGGMKRLAQQQLFKEEAIPEAAADASAIDAAIEEMAAVEPD